MSFRQPDRRHRISPDRELKEDPLSDRTRARIGVAAIVIGLITVVVGAWLVHATEAPVVDELGNELFRLIPRGWFWTTISQVTALNGVLLVMAGATFGFIYNRTLTWSRATLGAALFVGLMIIVFGVIPNQMLTLAQGPLEMSSSRILITIPPALILGNDVSISYETLKDMIVGGYAFTNVIVVTIVMVAWQNYTRTKDEPKPVKISEYGRPIRVQH